MVQSQLNRGNEQHVLDATSNMDMSTMVTKQEVCVFSLCKGDECVASDVVIKDLFKTSGGFYNIKDGTIVWERINAKWKKEEDVEKIGDKPLEKKLIEVATAYFQGLCKNTALVVSGHSNDKGIGVQVQWNARATKGGPILATGDQSIRYPFDSFRSTSDSKPLYIASCMCNGVTGSPKLCENRVINPAIKDGKHGWTSIEPSKNKAPFQKELGGFAGGKPADITKSKWEKLKTIDPTIKFITIKDDGDVESSS